MKGGTFIVKNVWIRISVAFHFSSQSLRYPYFQVGQILGPHPLSQEVKNARPVPQKQLSEPKPTESKVFTDTRKQQQHPHQPLQQIPLPQTEKPGGVRNAVSISAIQSNIYAIFNKRSYWNSTCEQVIFIYLWIALIVAYHFPSL